MNYRLEVPHDMANNIANTIDPQQLVSGSIGYGL